MAECELIPSCAFFNDRGPGYSPELHDILESRYCKDDNSECARLLATECIPREQIPPDLLPTDLERLRLICEETGHPMPRLHGLEQG